jgi:DNA-binding transcriptional ArsR family regulator
VTDWSQNVDMDEVFRALADANRRALLDHLFTSDGLSVSELCEVLPHMTRFGVMKHLGVLEAAHLITTRRDGADAREKRCYLNPVPIRELHDRWINKYTEPWAAAMVDLKKELESWPTPDTSSKRTSKPRRSRSGKA